MKIYTKTGDKGETGIIGGRISKGSSVIETVGTFDELNSVIGMVVSKIRTLKSEIRNNSQFSNLQSIQNTIFDIGAYLAGGKLNSSLKSLTSSLEKEIDKMDKELKPLQNFILPGGSEISATIHLARAICRRAERQFVRMLESKYKLDDEDKNILKFTNRLSDYLFVLARYVNKLSGDGEVVWKK